MANVKNDAVENVEATQVVAEVKVKDNGNKDVVEELNKQPKFKLMIPIDPTNPDEPFFVVVNGAIWNIPRNELVDVPQTVFEIAQESMRNTMVAQSQIKITGSNA